MSVDAEELRDALASDGRRPPLQGDAEELRDALASDGRRPPLQGDAKELRDALARDGHRPPLQGRALNHLYCTLTALAPVGSLKASPVVSL
jgi:hypothetical protein